MLLAAGYWLLAASIEDVIADLIRNLLKTGGPPEAKSQRPLSRCKGTAFFYTIRKEI